MVATASPLLRVLALLLAVLVLNSPAAADSLTLSAEPVQFDDTGLDRKSVGKLIWRGGLVLTSPDPDRDPRFKQLSALLVSDDGLRLTSVTDDGYWVTMGLVYDLKGHLSDVKDGKIGRLRGLDGEYIAKKEDEDAESLARWDDISLVVAFERIHRLWHYSPLLDATPTERIELPAFEPPNRKSNDGVEALVTLADGGLFAFIEGAENAIESSAYLQHNGSWKHLSYQHDEGFRPTGATRLRNGDVLVIERCFDFGPCDDNKTIVRLRRLDKQSIVPGAILVGEEIAELKAPFIVDNFEGVAVRNTESGETLVYLLSDDNGNKPPVQSTLLLMFALMD